MKKIFFGILLGIVTLLIQANEASAGVYSDAGSTLDKMMSRVGLQKDLVIIIGNVIRGALSLVGTIFLVLIIYAGFIYMTSGGNEQKVSKAKKIISSAVIGLIIILSSYSITTFVTESLISATR